MYTRGQGASQAALRRQASGVKRQASSVKRKQWGKSGRAIGGHTYVNAKVEFQGSGSTDERMGMLGGACSTQRRAKQNNAKGQRGGRRDAW